jgi:hypothetical protein
MTVVNLTAGTKEDLTVKLIDQSGRVTDLASLSPKYTLKDPTNAFVYNAATPIVSVAASGTLTSDATNVTARTPASSTITIDAATDVADGDTITIGGIPYRFKNTLAQAYDVKRDGTTTANTLDALIKAINGTGVVGTDYFTGTLKHPKVHAGTQTAHVVPITAWDAGPVGNTITTTTTSARLTLPGATFAAGTPSVAGDTVTIDTVTYEFYQYIGNEFGSPDYGDNQLNRVLKGSSAADSLQNLWYAINTTSSQTGIKFGQETSTHPTVYATTLTGTTLLVKSLIRGLVGNTYATTETSAHLSWGGALLSGGTGLSDSMTILCLIDTTAGNPTTIALTPGTYKLFASFTNGSEVPYISVCDVIIT